MIILLLALSQEAWYPLAEGHTWTYQAEDKTEYVRRVASYDAEKKVYRIEEPFMKEPFSIDSGGVKWRDTLWVKFPLKKGETWETEKDKVKGVVEDEEEIEVPAGKYKTFRVKLTTPAFEITMWLAKDVGEVKRTIKVGEKTGTLSLKEFKKGEKK